MPRFTRFLMAWAAFAALLTSPLLGVTVEEMKAVESKVKLVVAHNLPAVVGLFGDKVPGAGSGVVVSKDGLILTAAHVSKGNVVMKVRFPKCDQFPDGKEFNGKVLGANYTRDVSLLQIQESGPFPFVEVGDSDKLEPTSMVIGLGHPGGYDFRRTPPVRIGRISDKNFLGFLVSDCTLVSGDSGGPMFDLDGKVVGIHSSISEDLGFNRDAPVNAAKGDWTKLLAGESWGNLEGMSNNRGGGGGGRGSRNRAVIGGQFDVGSTNGVEATVVDAKSPLAAAGLLGGDVLRKLGERELKTTDDLVDALRQAKPGDKVGLVYTRDGVEHKAEVTLISEQDWNNLGGEPRARLERRNRR